MQKVLQSIFHDNVPAKAHARFWKWGVPSVLLVFAIPIAWVYIAYEIVDGPLRKACSEGDEITSFGLFMWSGPLLFIVGFAAFFWAARGFRGLRFLMKYPPKPVAQPEAQKVVPNVPVSLRPPSAEVMQHAKDFDDGAATVLVPKVAMPAIPRDLLTKPKLNYLGERFALGHLEDSFGIWYLHQEREPVQLFPRTHDGWNAAWTAFSEMEPRNQKL
jgi:hypothetical protein